MDMFETLKLLLDESCDYPDLFIDTILQQTIAEVEAYCNRPLDKELEHIVVRLVMIRMNRLNTEGIVSQSYSGVSESYLNGYPADIQAVLNRKRKPKFL